MKEFRGWKIKPDKLQMQYLRKFVIGNKISDIGCGRGWYVDFLSNLNKDAIGIDIKKDFANQNSKILADARKIPFRDNVFDTTIAFGVIEHIKEEEEVIKELLRITKHRLIVSVPNADDGFLPEYGLTFKHHKDKTHKREYLVSDIDNWCAKYGLNLVHISPENIVLPEVFGAFLRPKSLGKLYKNFIKILRHLRLFNLPKADIFAVFEVNH